MLNYSWKSALLFSIWCVFLHRLIFYITLSNLSSSEIQLSSSENVPINFKVYFLFFLCLTLSIQQYGIFVIDCSFRLNTNVRSQTVLFSNIVRESFKLFWHCHVNKASNTLQVEKITWKINVERRSNISLGDYPLLIYLLGGCGKCVRVVMFRHHTGNCKLLAMVCKTCETADSTQLPTQLPRSTAGLNSGSVIFDRQWNDTVLT